MRGDEPWIGSLLRRDTGNGGSTIWLGWIRVCIVGHRRIRMNVIYGRDFNHHMPHSSLLAGLTPVEYVNRLKEGQTRTELNQKTNSSGRRLQATTCHKLT